MAMQHQLWVARQAVLRRLGSREDACVVSSDAELDAKLELFRSVSESSALLQRLSEQQRERAATLAQEEAALGGFLREAAAAGTGGAQKALSQAGKALSFVGAQRGTQRAPLGRLQRELDTFRARGVADTRVTVLEMERARHSYRAALSWMKAASARLDPDSGAGLQQFRKAQAQVRQSKAHFDKLTLDCLQKVDLLAAARCNMFSHVLVNYQNSLLNFTTKSAHTLSTTAQALSEAPAYEFCILKELSQIPPDELGENSDSVDKDQMLFFQDEFKDIKASENTNTCTDAEGKVTTSDESCNNIIANLIDSLDQLSEGNDQSESKINPDLAGLNLNNDAYKQIGSFMPSQLLQDLTSDFLQTPTSSQNLDRTSTAKSEIAPSNINESLPVKKQDNQKKDRAMWFKLFAELDPLANPDAMPGVNANQSHAA
ncbi:islet cell autoantigen 1-like protein [Arctopsyche grandis]|uniref:islet cell autoantigen 1-like protein n=1 Tax=Arctopsyche grandis TaxID=121162 RepID=UPI00406D6748